MMDRYHPVYDGVAHSRFDLERRIEERERQGEREGVSRYRIQQDVDDMRGTFNNREREGERNKKR